MKDPVCLHWVTRESYPHHAIHARKVRALRAAGLGASLWVSGGRPAGGPPAAIYDALEAEGLLDFRNGLDRRHSLLGALGLAREALRHRHLVVHALRADVSWLLRIRRVWPRLQGRLSLVLELEGDKAAEHDYRAGEQDRGRTLFLEKRDANWIKAAQGLILRSEPHAALWRERGVTLPPLVVMPDLFDPLVHRPNLFRREVLRGARGWGRDDVVLAYSGNTNTRWQRFPETCLWLRRLLDLGKPIRLLGLIRDSDLRLARAVVREHGLETASSLQWVAPEEVAGYLGAADFGLFLREDHLMTRITTSAKLGEYLACGLPVVTTGCGALYHPLVEALGAGVTISPDLPADEAFWGRLEAVRARFREPAARSALSAEVHRHFFASDPYAPYVALVRRLMAAQESGGRPPRAER